MSSSVSTRTATNVTRGLAAQFQPIVDVRDALQSRFDATIDVELIHARINKGRAGFDAAKLLASVGDLTRAFGRTATAFERTGIASAASIASARQFAQDAGTLAVAWANSESLPRDPARLMARSIVALMGNAILARAASQVTLGFNLASWKRPHCPCCGASPDLALVVDGARTLVCWRCDTMWRSEKQGCLSCGESDPMTVSRISSPHLGYELAICNACGRYLKERPGPLTLDLLVERALTAGLDEAARQRGLQP